MKRLSLLAAVAAALIAPAAASAHPLGNFTINRFSRIEVSGPRLYVFYVLDMAEIPTYQAGKIDVTAYEKRIAAGARLTVAGRPVALTPIKAASPAHPPGAGGLRTRGSRSCPRPSSTPRRGSRIATRTTAIASAGRRSWSARTPSCSNELRAYPKDMLEPADITSATASAAPTSWPDALRRLARQELGGA